MNSGVTSKDIEKLTAAVNKFAKETGEIAKMLRPICEVGYQKLRKTFNSGVDIPEKELDEKELHSIMPEKFSILPTDEVSEDILMHSGADVDESFITKLQYSVARSNDIEHTNLYDVDPEKFDTLPPSEASLWSEHVRNHFYKDAADSSDSNVCEYINIINVKPEEKLCIWGKITFDNNKLCVFHILDKNSGKTLTALGKPRISAISYFVISRFNDTEEDYLIPIRDGDLRYEVLGYWRIYQVLERKV